MKKLIRCEFCECCFFSSSDYEKHLFVFTRGRALHSRIRDYLRVWAWRVDSDKWFDYMKDYSSRCNELNFLDRFAS